MQFPHWQKLKRKARKHNCTPWLGLALSCPVYKRWKVPTSLKPSSFFKVTKPVAPFQGMDPEVTQLVTLQVGKTNTEKGGSSQKEARGDQSSVPGRVTASAGRKGQEILPRPGRPESGLEQGEWDLFWAAGE